MKHLILAITLILGKVMTSSSQNLEYPEIDKQMPSFEINDFYGKSGKSFNNNNLIGSYTILAFWTRSCKSCVEMFPKYKLLKSFYGERLNLVLVSYNDKKTKTIYESKYKELRLNFDSAFIPPVCFGVFGIRSVPTYIWIGPNGVVKAVTWSEEVNVDNIGLFLGNKDFGFLDQSVNAQYNRSVKKEK